MKKYFSVIALLLAVLLSGCQTRNPDQPTTEEILREVYTHPEKLCPAAHPSGLFFCLKNGLI